ncbi:InlB B-repeat-containing protein, partial [Hominenteromicrobium sp.]|uniref:InlB B-repeat-containing protein n=1 Tax=Hominenteromicrobium sp. TaxID=3073581 RepID=UPI003AB6C329
AETTIKVNVIKNTFKRCEEPDPITEKKLGTTFAGLNLPKTVVVEAIDGLRVGMEVSWEESSYDAQSTAWQTIPGTLVFDANDEHKYQQPEPAVTAAIRVKLLGSEDAPAITTTSLPGGTVGSPYHHQLQATGGGFILWELFSGELPDGLTLKQTTGEISGTPTAEETATFTVRALNSVGNDKKELSITIAKDAPAEYTVRFNANGGGGTMADVTGVTGSYTLPACGFTEPEGKQFKGWSTSADGSVISGTTYEVSSDTTFYAIWESKEYSIIVTDGKATIGAGSEISKAAQGTKVTLTANAAPDGKVFDKWVVESGNTTLEDANSETTTFIMPDSEVSVKAAYKTTPVTTYNLTTQVNGGHGTISASKTGLTAGSTETITFTPDAGYEIDTVTVNGTATSVSGNTLNVTMNENKTVVVTYKAIEYNITVTDGKATIGAGSEISKAAQGTTITLTANAAPSGKVFDKWEVVSGDITLADASSATTTFTMLAGAVSVKATYKDAPHTHTFDQEIVKPEALKSAADCTNDAVYFKSCSCGEISTTETFTAAGTQLGHAWASDWSKDTDNHWKECSRCHEKKDEAAHDYGSDNICDTCGYDKTVPHTHNLTLVPAKAPTCTEKGNTAYYTCDGCDKWFEDATGASEITDKTSVILAATGHSASDWKSDNTDHWKECTVVGCGVIIEGSKAAHTAGEWIIDTPATATTSGSKHKECTVCGYTMATETIPATGGGEHTHSYGSEWKNDADNHWHECSCGDKKDTAAHTAGEWIIDTPATATTDGSKHKECTVCGYTMATETIPATGGGEHTHSYGSDWKNDATNHWHECSCGDKADKAAHDFKWVVDKEATATQKGSKHEECKVCGYKKAAVEIPATGTPTEPGKPTGPDSPQTGDNSNMILWIALLFISGGAVIGITVYSKRKKENAE